MEFRKFILLLNFYFSVSSFFAQNETDLYRFSKTTYSGTARFESMGGAFGALGADLSCSAINPAGYARYSSNQFGISIYGASNQNKSIFANNLIETNKSQGGISNLGLVLTEDISEKSNGFLYQQLAINFNQIENFTNSFRYQGQQYASLLDQFVGQSQGYYPEELNSYFPFSTDLAYQTGAIQYDNTSQEFYSLLNNGDVIHNRTVNSKGGARDLSVSMSTNYLNKLYIGACIGLRFYKYKEEYTHTEFLTDTSNTSLRSFDYNYSFTTQGTGFNIKLGTIYLPNEFIRIGVAFHTPTFSELTDIWSASMTSNFANISASIPQNEIPTGNYKYKIRNPYRVVGSMAFLLGTRGCLSVDAEYLNYANSKFKSTDDLAYDPYNYEFENALAKQVFQKAINFRGGCEFVIFPGLYLRAGYSYYGNAFKMSENADLQPEIFFTSGIGVKYKKMFFDLAFKRRNMKRNYYAFPESITTLIQQNTSIILSGTVQF
jgi:hypothetical protein